MNWQSVATGLLSLIGIFVFNVGLQAQEPPSPPPLNLPLLAPEAVPDSGNFYSAAREWPPLPYNPYADETNVVVPVYSIGAAMGKPANAPFYLFDDRAAVALEELAKAAVQKLGMATMKLPEFPGDGEGGGDGSGDTNNRTWVFSTNDLWVELDLVSLTNGSANLLLHVPEFYTNAVWDVFATTNLNLDFPGLNGTNWTLVARTESGATNLTVPRLSDYQTYYRIAKTNDLDGDGLTDAFEALVSHSSPTTNDTDGDGMPDGWEWTHNLNPNNAADAPDDPDGDWLTNLQEYNGGSNPNDVMVLAWGRDNGGQLAVPVNLQNVVAIDGGLASSLALRADGSVTGWGSGAEALPSWTNATQLSATSDQVAIVKLDGTVSLLETGYGLPPANLTNAVQVAAGYQFCVVVRSDGTVTAWGTNNAGQSIVPTNLPSAKAVAAGLEHAVVLLQDGTVRSWGQNYPSWGWNVTSVPVGLSNVAAIAVGDFHTLALKVDGTVVAWGAGTVTNNSSLYGADKGQSVVPPGLSNVVAVSAGGYHSMALKADGTVVVWGDLADFPRSAVQGHITGIGSGELHGLALRSGRLTPLMVSQPTDQAGLPGGTVTFAVVALGLADVHYQWQTNGVNIFAATNSTLALSNVSTNDEGTYRVIISTGAGLVISSNAVFQIVTPPVIASQPTPTNQTLIYRSNMTFSVSGVAPGQFSDFPISYQWQLNGTNIAGVTSSNYTFKVEISGDYSALVSNAAGGTSTVWRVGMTYEGSYMAPGTLAHHLSTNAVGYATGRTGNLSDQLLLSGWALVYNEPANLHWWTNAIWSTNCWLKGVRGLSATSIGVMGAYGGHGLPTMISPRHCLYAEHTHPGQSFFVAAFLGTNNVLHWRTNMETVRLGDDVSVGILDSDLPATVEFVPVLPANFTNYLPNTVDGFVQGIGMNQLMKVGCRALLFYGSVDVNWVENVTAPLGLSSGWLFPVQGGDSSTPERLLVYDQCVLLTCKMGTTGGPNYAHKINTINQAMHYLSTNNGSGTDYQMNVFSLTNWPSIR